MDFPSLTPDCAALWDHLIKVFFIFTFLLFLSFQAAVNTTVAKMNKSFRVRTWGATETCLNTPVLDFKKKKQNHSSWKQYKSKGKCTAHNLD